MISRALRTSSGTQAIANYNEGQCQRQRWDRQAWVTTRRLRSRNRGCKSRDSFPSPARPLLSPSRCASVHGVRRRARHVTSSRIAITMALSDELLDGTESCFAATCAADKIEWIPLSLTLVEYPQGRYECTTSLIVLSFHLAINYFARIFLLSSHGQLSQTFARASYYLIIFRSRLCRKWYWCNRIKDLCDHFE